MSSFTQDDITNLNNANGLTTRSRFHGWRTGAARCTFTATSGKAIGTHGLGLTIPKGALVTKAYYKVLTTFTSATDAATIALQVKSANDLVTAVAISNGGNPWDAGGGVVCTPTGTLANEVDNDTADSEVSAVVAVEALTAGKLVLWVEWAYYGDLALT